VHRSARRTDEDVVLSNDVFTMVHFRRADTVEYGTLIAIAMDRHGFDQGNYMIG